MEIYPTQQSTQSKIIENLPALLDIYHYKLSQAKRNTAEYVAYQVIVDILEYNCFAPIGLERMRSRLFNEKQVARIMMTIESANAASLYDVRWYRTKLDLITEALRALGE